MYCLLSNKYIGINRITEILKEIERQNCMNGSSRNTGLMWPMVRVVPLDKLQVFFHRHKNYRPLNLQYRWENTRGHLIKVNHLLTQDITTSASVPLRSPFAAFESPRNISENRKMNTTITKTQEVTLTNILGHSKHLLKRRKRFEEQVPQRVPSYPSVHDDSIPPLHESVKGHLIGVGNTAQ